MTLPSKFTDPILRISLTLAQYPILGDRIREMMRQELFDRGVISEPDLEALVRKRAIRSQKLEGIRDPLHEEDGEVWEMRQQRVRDHLTDFYFATNLPYELFEDMVTRTLARRKADEDNSMIFFNPELAPKYMLFEQARLIEEKPPAERERLEPHLQEIKVVLIRAMISDHLEYVGIAKKWLTMDDLRSILRRKISYGKIGGKAAGMLLAYRILQAVCPDEIRENIEIPESYYLGADMMYTYMRMNGLLHWNDQKYQPEEKIRADYSRVVDEYLGGEFPRDVLERLYECVEAFHGKPLIVRSSSLLEDNFGTSFAGKYDSYFCPNQGTIQENLAALVDAIKRIYASVLNPDALLYRRTKGLQDYDERMAILIQVVQGEKMGKYFFPHAAGVAFGHNLYRWAPQIRQEDGFLRLVWGLGTRAVDRVGNDYPRLVALSHPTLRPESAPGLLQRYSQQYVDLIDLEENTFKTLPVREVITPQYKILRYIAQLVQDNYVTNIRTILSGANIQQLVLTMDGVLSRTPFPDRMRRMLNALEEHYNLPVDMEFTISIENPNEIRPNVRISILQCRPQSHLKDVEARLPEELNPAEVLFSTRRMVPQGRVGDIQYVIFVPAEAYFALTLPAQRTLLAQAIGRLNSALKGKTFICIGPGRWGTSNPDLGIPVGFGDVYNSRSLVEVTGEGIGEAPEPSFGTHFFQDLMETKTFPLAIYLEDPDVIYNRDFLYNTHNSLENFLPAEILNDEPFLYDCLRLIDVKACRPDASLELVMDNNKNRAAAFFSPKSSGI